MTSVESPVPFAYQPLYNPYEEGLVSTLANAFTDFGNLFAGTIPQLLSAAESVQWSSDSRRLYDQAVQMLGSQVLQPAADSLWKIGEILDAYAQQVQQVQQQEAQQAQHDAIVGGVSAAAEALLGVIAALPFITGVAALVGAAVTRAFMLMTDVAEGVVASTATVTGQLASFITVVGIEGGLAIASVALTNEIANVVSGLHDPLVTPLDIALAFGLSGFFHGLPLADSAVRGVWREAGGSIRNGARPMVEPNPGEIPNPGVTKGELPPSLLPPAAELHTPGLSDVGSGVQASASVRSAGEFSPTIEPVNGRGAPLNGPVRPNTEPAPNAPSERVPGQPAGPVEGPPAGPADPAASAPNIVRPANFGAHADPAATTSVNARVEPSSAPTNQSAHGGDPQASARVENAAVASSAQQAVPSAEAGVRADVANHSAAPTASDKVALNQHGDVAADPAKAVAHEVENMAATADPTMNTTGPTSAGDVARVSESVPAAPVRAGEPVPATQVRAQEPMSATPARTLDSVPVAPGRAPESVPVHPAQDRVSPTSEPGSPVSDHSASTASRASWTSSDGAPSEHASPSSSRASTNSENPAPEPVNAAPNHARASSEPTAAPTNATHSAPADAAGSDDVNVVDYPAQSARLAEARAFMAEQRGIDVRTGAPLAGDKPGRPDMAGGSGSGNNADAEPAAAAGHDAATGADAGTGNKPGVGGDRGSGTDNGGGAGAAAKDHDEEQAQIGHSAKPNQPLHPHYVRKDQPGSTRSGGGPAKSSKGGDFGGGGRSRGKLNHQKNGTATVTETHEHTADVAEQSTETVTPQAKTDAPETGALHTDTSADAPTTVETRTTTETSTSTEAASRTMSPGTSVRTDGVSGRETGAEPSGVRPADEASGPAGEATRAAAKADTVSGGSNIRTMSDNRSQANFDARPGAGPRARDTATAGGEAHTSNASDVVSPADRSRSPQPSAASHSSGAETRSSGAATAQKRPGGGARVAADVALAKRYVGEVEGEAGVARKAAEGAEVAAARGNQAAAGDFVGQAHVAVVRAREIARLVHRAEGSALEERLEAGGGSLPGGYGLGDRAEVGVRAAEAAHGRAVAAQRLAGVRGRELAARAAEADRVLSLKSKALGGAEAELREAEAGLAKARVSGGDVVAGERGVADATAVVRRLEVEKASAQEAAKEVARSYSLPPERLEGGARVAADVALAKRYVGEVEGEAGVARKAAEGAEVAAGRGDHGAAGDFVGQAHVAVVRARGIARLVHRAEGSALEERLEAGGGSLSGGYGLGARAEVGVRAAEAAHGRAVEAQRLAGVRAKELAARAAEADRVLALKSKALGGAEAGLREAESGLAEARVSGGDVVASERRVADATAVVKEAEAAKVEAVTRAKDAARSYSLPPERLEGGARVAADVALAKRYVGEVEGEAGVAGKAAEGAEVAAGRGDQAAAGGVCGDRRMQRWCGRGRSARLVHRAEGSALEERLEAAGGVGSRVRLVGMGWGIGRRLGCGRRRLRMVGRWQRRGWLGCGGGSWRRVRRRPIGCSVEVEGVGWGGGWVAGGGIRVGRGRCRRVGM